MTVGVIGLGLVLAGCAGGGGAPTTTVTVTSAATSTAEQADYLDSAVNDKVGNKDSAALSATMKTVAGVDILPSIAGHMAESICRAIGSGVPDREVADVVVDQWDGEWTEEQARMFALAASLEFCPQTIE